jgi:hypothetical protein
MKKLLLLFIFIPAIGIAQTETRDKNAFLRPTETFNPVEKRFKMQFVKHTEIPSPKSLNKVPVKTPMENYILLDSIYIYEFDYSESISLPDSSVSGKSIIAYSASGNQVSRINHIWNKTNERWEKYTKEESTYDANRNVISYRLYSWNESISQWIGTYSYEATFDENSNNTSYTSIVWDPQAGQWINSWKEDYNYDENGNLLGYTGYDWYIPLNQFIVSYMGQITYDEYGRQTLLQQYSWNGLSKDWAINWKAENTYSGDGNAPVLYISYNWNVSDSVWIEEYKSENTYDQNDNLIMSIQYNSADPNDLSVPYKATNIWLKAVKQEYTYDANGKLTSHITYSWNGSQWIGSSKSESGYDANGNETLNITYNWDDATADWIGSARTESAYDAEGFLTTFIYSPWDNIISQFVPVEKGYYYYSSRYVTGGIDPQNQEMVKLFPNPAKEEFTLEMTDNHATIGKVFNSNGLMIKTLSINAGTNTYNIRDLASGVYYIQISTQSGIIIRKMIKE